MNVLNVEDIERELRRYAARLYYDHTKRWVMTVGRNYILGKLPEKDVIANFREVCLCGFTETVRLPKRCKHDPDKKWAADLAAMIQVSLIGYAAGGTFLGMSYFDLPYHLMIILLLAAKFTGLLEKQNVPIARFSKLPEASRQFN